MKKIILILTILLFQIDLGYSQNVAPTAPQELIIYCTSNKNTNLFFSSAIKSGIVGNSNFTFGYSSNGDSKIGILKATPGAESNLLVITSNGNIYSFIVRYKAEISMLNYFVKDNMAIGNESGSVVFEDGTGQQLTKGEEKVSNAEPEPKSKIVESIKVNNYESTTVAPSSNDSNKLQSTANKEIEKPVFYNRIYGSKNKVTIKLKNISYVDNELYFTLVLSNESTLDYDINYLNFYIISRNKNRNTVAQTIPYEALYIHNNPTKILAKEETEVVFVYKKFTINENKILLVELTEDNGERTVKLEIPNTFINNPN
ncbi:DUF4138 domain-containing protein [Flavobacterium sp. GSB-24]|uniref:DUF4138 domain-containing protein n=1 Tax=Flavobacterium sp. GSB-24 TaxID=2994319 RepID=UPI002490800B|nr:DUF4138 domain-containing protein [Flavobacterium sp. GSB-24]BDU27670.1 hypothetical protein FLGSB24_44140 [Flavobacterium sp. GSB-24]